MLNAAPVPQVPTQKVAAAISLTEWIQSQAAVIQHVQGGAARKLYSQQVADAVVSLILDHTNHLSR